jgi:hypothetical protein
LRGASRATAPRTFRLTRISNATLPLGLRPAPGRRPAGIADGRSMSAKHPMEHLIAAPF